MKFLIICSYFPPDSAIASTRPYMLAKYLRLSGHEVTVLRSGNFDKHPDPDFPPLPRGIRVISFLGKNCDAARFTRGEYQPEQPGKRKIDFLPVSFRRRFSPVYQFFRNPYDACKMISTAKKNFKRQRRVIDKLSAEKYDVVFSTYSELENIFAGEYASKKLGAAWIMDLRDPVINAVASRLTIWNIYAERAHRRLLRRADMCTVVSEDMRHTMLAYGLNSEVYTLYNGAETGNGSGSSPETCNSGVLTFCYTGQFYQESFKGLMFLLNCLRGLIDSGQISADKLRFIHAGPHSTDVKQIFRSYSLEGILEDHGYVPRHEATLIQERSDIFLILSWNTKSSQGVLTGKFYEGIRSNKPMLSIVHGDLPDSELFVLNEKYNYGYCCETVRHKDSDPELADFILKYYREKMTSGKISFERSQELADKFDYKNIAARLEELARRAIEIHNK